MTMIDQQEFKEENILRCLKGMLFMLRKKDTQFLIINVFIE